MLQSILDKHRHSNAASSADSGVEHADLTRQKSECTAEDKMDTCSGEGSLEGSLVDDRQNYITNTDQSTQSHTQTQSHTHSPDQPTTCTDDSNKTVSAQHVSANSSVSACDRPIELANENQIDSSLVDMECRSSSRTSSSSSSLQAFSSATSGDNSPSCTDTEDNVDQSSTADLPSTTLMSPPKIVITDFSFDDPTDITHVDPFEGVQQSSSVCSYSITGLLSVEST